MENTVGHVCSGTKFAIGMNTVTPKEKTYAIGSGKYHCADHDFSLDVFRQNF
jgi:hypothetical protein